MPSRIPEKVRHPLRVRTLEVRAIKRPAPHYALVTFGGDDLADFRTLSPTDHVKVIPPAPGAAAPVLPRVDEGRLAWDGEKPVFRDYTVRRFDPEALELDLRFLAHGGGPLSRWADAARVGDRVGVIGPRGSKVQPDGYANYVLVGDRTAIPAIARWLGELPVGATAQVLLAVTGEEDVVEMRSSEAIAVRWLTEGGSGPEADQLPAALEALELCSPDTWAWAAGEAVTMREVRRILLEKPGLSLETVTVTGYWRRGQADHDHHTSLDRL